MFESTDPRQRVNICPHLTDEVPFQVDLKVVPVGDLISRPVARLQLIDGFGFQTQSPAMLREIARACYLAADRLEHPSSSPSALSVVR